MSESPKSTPSIWDELVRCREQCEQYRRRAEAAEARAKDAEKEYEAVYWDRNAILESNKTLEARVKVLEKELDAAEEKLQWLDYHYPEPVAIADELFGTKREKCAALYTANVLHEDCQDNRGCPVCGYDCAGANPPVSSCPLRAPPPATEDASDA